MPSGKLNVLSVIVDQHKKLKKFGTVLRDESAEPTEKRECLEKFIEILKMHSDAEEKTIYNVLGELKDSELIIFEAREEHGIAKRLVIELEEGDYKSTWDNQTEAKAKVLAELVAHHAGEEEEKMFAAARRNFTPLELEAIGEKFLEICNSFAPEIIQQPEVAPVSSEMPLS